MYHGNINILYPKYKNVTEHFEKVNESLGLSSLKNKAFVNV